jgi:glycosyltransferase involved in cell wall biosynthesis
MKILHVIPRMIGGGPERSVMALASEMAAIGYAHKNVIAVLDPPVSRNMLLAARRLKIDVVMRPGKAALRRLMIDADIVQIHYWNHPALLTLLRGMEFPPARVVVFSRVLGLTTPQILTEPIGRFGDALVLTSPASGESAGARAARASGRPVVVLPAVADMSRLDGFARRLHDGCVVGYLGVVNETKMHPRFAQMAAQVTHPSIRFLVCGGGGGEVALRRELEALGVGPRTEILGPVEDISQVLASMDIFGYPLAEQTYATSEKALQEAMWVGLPPVVFPHGGVRLLVQHECTGLVARSESEYVAAIDRLAADANLRSCLGLAAQKFAKEQFDPRRWANAAVALMEEVASWPRRERAPLEGADGAAGFVAALGDLAGPFATSLVGLGAANMKQVEAADHCIATSHAALARGEGGVIHYRNAASHDPALRLWSGLLAEAAGNFDHAQAEYEAVRMLGWPDRRPDLYLARCAGLPSTGMPKPVSPTKVE